MGEKEDKIVTVTQLRDRSGRHIGELIIGFFPMILSVFFAGLFIYTLFLPMIAVRPESVGNWIIFVIFYIFLLCCSGGATLVCFYVGKFQLKIKPKWKFTLFSNKMTAYTLEPDFKEMKETVIPIEKVIRCVIVRRERRVRLHVNQRSFFRYYFYLGAHIYYEVKGQEELMSFEDPNDLDELDQAVHFLQNEWDIPMYFTHVKDDDHVPIDIHKLIQSFPPKRFTLPHQLKQLDQRNYNISISKELRRQQQNGSSKSMTPNEHINKKES